MTSETPGETATVAELIGRKAVDPDGDKIGSIDEVYLDNDTGQPEWLAISTGLFGTKMSFAPLSGAIFTGDDVQIPYSKQQVKDSPTCEADGQLSRSEEEVLYAHYGWSSGTTGTTTMGTTTTGTTGRVDESTRSTDDAMTRSEEELDVSTQTQETGRARLRKWVETENVQMTVPIQREKARMVVEPVTEGNVDDALSGPDLTESEHEVVLSEEVVDVDKRVVPKERVRLETDVETDEVVVDEAVRKERIDFDHDAG